MLLFFPNSQLFIKNMSHTELSHDEGIIFICVNFREITPNGGKPA